MSVDNRKVYKLKVYGKKNVSEIQKHMREYKIAEYKVKPCPAKHPAEKCPCVDSLIRMLSSMIDRNMALTRTWFTPVQDMLGVSAKLPDLSFHLAVFDTNCTLGSKGILYVIKNNTYVTKQIEIAYTMVDEDILDEEEDADDDGVLV